jgi:hypothetical protein
MDGGRQIRNIEEKGRCQVMLLKGDVVLAFP